MPDEQTTEITFIPPKPLRDERGRLLPGQSANPSGRPKTKHITEAMRHYLGCTKGRYAHLSADAIARRILEIAANGKDPISVQAIHFITEQMEGKPTQRIEVEQSIDPQTAERLADIADKLALAR